MKGVHEFVESTFVEEPIFMKRVIIGTMSEANTFFIIKDERAV